MFRNISSVLSVIALLISIAIALLWYRESGDSVERVQLQKRVVRLEQDIDELFTRSSQGKPENKLENSLAFSVLREELKKMKEELAIIRTSIVGGTAQRQAISDICGAQQADRWADMAATLSDKFLTGFSKGLSTVSIDEETRESVLSAYNGILQDTSSNQVAWMKGKIDATELSERMVDSAAEFRLLLENSVSPSLVNKILVLAFPDPTMRAQLFSRERK